MCGLLLFPPTGIFKILHANGSFFDDVTALALVHLLPALDFLLAATTADADVGVELAEADAGILGIAHGVAPPEDCMAPLWGAVHL